MGELPTIQKGKNNKFELKMKKEKGEREKERRRVMVNTLSSC